MTHNSRIGANYRYMMYELNISLNIDYKDILEMSNEFCNMVIERWNTGLNDIDKRLGEHVLELIERRDSLDTWILNKKEIQDVIEMLTTG